MKTVYLAIAVALLLPATSFATDTEAEIEFLLTSIGDSECIFIRNGKRHNAAAAEDHLRTKYRRGKRYAPTTEMFIERLASASSMSKKAYYIECPGAEAVPTGEWLAAQLDDYRNGSDDPR